MQIAPDRSSAKFRNRPVVCYVTGGTLLPVPYSAELLLANIRVAVAAGVDWVQIREHNLPSRELMALVRAAALIAGKNVRVIVNDRLDIAIAGGAAGVHLRGESLPARDAVSWCRSGNAPADFLIGASCHSPDDGRAAEIAGVSYVVFGPIFETPSKQNFGPPQGLLKLAKFCLSIQLPVIAIGGVNEKNGEECLRAGAAGIAAIRMFQQPGNSETMKSAITRLHQMA